VGIQTHDLLLPSKFFFVKLLNHNHVTVHRLNDMSCMYDNTTYVCTYIDFFVAILPTQHLHDGSRHELARCGFFVLHMPGAWVDIVFLKKDFFVDSMLSYALHLKSCKCLFQGIALCRWPTDVLLASI
jgi:hypothetical protein